MKIPLRQNSRAELFLTLLDDYAGYVQIAGHTVFREPRQNGIDLFNSLPHSRQEALFARLNVDLSILQAAVREGDDLNDSSKMLWRFLKTSKLSPCSDLFERIKNGDVVELYGTDQKHLWQNMAFFDWVSVSLERIYSDTWFNVTTRDPIAEKGLAECATKVFTGAINGTIQPNVPWHLLEELDSDLLMKFDILVKAMSPVYSNGSIVGLITVNQCREV